MTPEQIHTAATVSARYAEFNAASKAARNAIKDVIFSANTILLHDEQKKHLYETLDLLEMLMNNSSTREAIKYISNLPTE